ncbi:MAG: glycosyltransferase family 9 protein [Nitrospinota bacterium]
MKKKEILKALDTVVGGLLAVFLGHFLTRRARNPRFPQKAKCLIIRPGGIGDAVSLIPAINSIKECHPHWKIDVLAEKRNGEVFSACKSVSKIYLYDRKLELLRCLSKRYDVAIDTEQWHRLSALTALFSSPFTIGFETNERGKLFSIPCKYSLDTNEIESFMQLTEWVSQKKSPRDLFFAPPFLTPGVDVSETNVKKIGRLGKGKRVCISVGGSIPEKIWEKDSFITLINRLFQRGINVILIGGAEEKQMARQINNGLLFSENLNKKILDLTGDTTLLETAAIMRKTDLLLCGDTGILHLGAAIGIPTLSLFGPGNPRKWAPRGRRHKHLTGDAPCSPCSKFGYTPKCSKDALCIKTISVSDVERAVLFLLANS